MTQGHYDFEQQKTVPDAVSTDRSAIAFRQKTRRRTFGLRWAIRIALLCCLVFGFLTIRYLTEQTSSQTSALSGAVQDYAAAKAHLIEAGQAPPIRSNPLKWVARRMLWVSYKLSGKGIDIRHQAHMVEFGLMGGIIALNVLAWMSGWAQRRDGRARIHLGRVGLMLLLSTGLCLLASLSDQFHKLSVPGWHFDTWDLVFDASGYLTAVVVVFIAWGFGNLVYRAIANRLSASGDAAVPKHLR